MRADRTSADQWERGIAAGNRLFADLRERDLVRSNNHALLKKGTTMSEATTDRPLSTIAREIHADWTPKGKGVNYAAKPYLEAMMQMGDIAVDYGHDTGPGVVRYFLCNASSWRGETAKRVKAELKGMLAR